MTDKLKSTLDQYNIDLVKVLKSELTLQVGLEGLAQLIHHDKEEKVESYKGETLTDQYGKSAIGLFTIKLPLDEEVLEKFKGGEFIFLTTLGEEMIIGNLYKIEK